MQQPFKLVHQKYPFCYLSTTQILKCFRKLSLNIHNAISVQIIQVKYSKCLVLIIHWKPICSDNSLTNLKFETFSLNALFSNTNLLPSLTPFVYFESFQFLLKPPFPIHLFPIAASLHSALYKVSFLPIQFPLLPPKQLIPKFSKQSHAK